MSEQVQPSTESALVEALLQQRRQIDLELERIQKQQIQRLSRREREKAQRQPVTQAKPNHLSPREMQVVVLLHEGLTNKEIANELNISERSVKFHLRGIFVKTGLQGRIAVANWVGQMLPSDEGSLTHQRIASIENRLLHRIAEIEAHFRSEIKTILARIQR